MRSVGLKPKAEIAVMSTKVQDLCDGFIRNAIGVFLLNEYFGKRIVGIIFPKVSPVIVLQGNRMIKFMKVIEAKVVQHSPTKRRDFKKVGPKSLQFRESMFLSLLLTQFAENFSRIVGETGTNLLTLS